MSPQTRDQKNKYNRKFKLIFVEQVYPGSPRPITNKYWRRHTRTSNAAIDREHNVNKEIKYAHKTSRTIQSSPYLATCINPSCSDRKQTVSSENSIRAELKKTSRSEQEKSELRKEYTSLRARYLKNIENLTAGKALTPAGEVAPDKSNDSFFTCPTCKSSKIVYGVTAIKGKWIYILKKLSSGKLYATHEIEYDSTGASRIARRTSNGRFPENIRRPYESVSLDDRHEWHFFLSPVKLRKQSLELLQNSKQEEWKLHNDCVAANPNKCGVIFNKHAQPWATTVFRKFDKNNLKVKQFEYLPLVNPFSWASAIADIDYAPILASQHLLARDPNEQNKAFIASTLQQVIGAKLVPDTNPPKWKRTDKWEIKEETVPAKGSIKPNIALAWTHRYQKALKYLTIESNKAAARLVFVLRYSLAHRIVELACQEADQTPNHLSIAMVHWAHVLHDILASDAGSEFTTWLANPNAKSGIQGAADRVPYKNVILGEGLKNNTKLAKEVKDLPLLIYTQLCGAIVSQNKEPMEQIKQHLENMNLQTAIEKSPTGESVITFDKVKSVRDIGLKVSDQLVSDYLGKLPEKKDSIEVAAKYRKGDKFSKGIKFISNIVEFESILSLYGAFKEFSKKKSKYANDNDALKDATNKVKAAASVGEFIGKNTRRAMSLGLSKASRDTIEKLEKKGAKSLSQLTTHEFEALLGNRLTKSYRLMGIGLKVLSGPVGILTGGMELVANGKDIARASDQDNTGLMIGHGLQAASSVMLIAVAGAECVALATAGAVATFAGPIGILAAVFILVGAAIIAYFSDNDLQLFSRHCYLGKRYGHGNDRSDKSWMNGMRWKELKFDGYGEETASFRQKMALLRLMSGFRIYKGTSNSNGATISLSYAPEGAHFEIEIDIIEKGDPTLLYSDKIDRIRLTYDPNTRKPKSHGRVDIINFNDELSFELRGIRENVSIKSLPNIKVRARLDLFGNGKEHLPASGNWVELKGDKNKFGTYSQLVHSASVM